MPSARYRSAHHLAVDAATMNITAERIVTCADPELPAYVPATTSLGFAASGPAPFSGVEAAGW